MAGRAAPVREPLIGPLSDIFRDATRSETERSIATDILADYAADSSHVLAELLLDAEEKQFTVIYPKFKAAGEDGARLLFLELEKSPPENGDLKQLEKLAKRQANAGAAAIKLNQPEKVWPLLKYGPDPRVRSYLIHRLAPLGCDPAAIVARLGSEPDVTARRALVLSLGEFTELQLPAAQRAKLSPMLQAIYLAENDPGLHSAADWLLRQWGKASWLKTADQQLLEGKAGRNKALHDLVQATGQATGPLGAAKPHWFIDSRGQTMIVVSATSEFMMGAPLSEVGREDDEFQHKQQIGRTFAISSKPVTVMQFREFDPDLVLSARQATSPECPVVNVSWHQAAAYCNWLSRQEGIAPAQWCYEVDARGQVTKMKDGFLSLAGYRLPTEAEMEYATRTGTTTSRYFGETDELLSKYAWSTRNAHDHTWPVAMLKPNDFGLFDAEGNAYGWCHDAYEQYDKSNSPVADQEGKLTIDPIVPRVLRGGSFNSQALELRSAYRHINVPAYRSSYLTFRPACTIAAGR